MCKLTSYCKVSTCLDSLAQSVLDETPDFNEFSARQKARTIASYLKERSLTGIKDDEYYYNLQNNFIGMALQDNDHPSLPLISVAIYCCVSQRLGLCAYPCGFPFHVLAIIKPAKDLSMDGRRIQSSEDSEPIYMDPFRSDHEIPVSDLRGQLAAMGVSKSEYGGLLDSSSTIDIVGRTARNIINAIHNGPHIHNTSASSGSPAIDSDSAFYGALWALVLLPEGSSAVNDTQKARYLPYVMEHLKNQFSMDIGLAEQYILPIFDSVAEQFILPIFNNLRPVAAICETARAIRASESEPKSAKRRTRTDANNVKYQVGQFFTHMRYRYQAAIIGWDSECGATEEWMSQMSVDNLVHGRHQSFYHVL